MPVDAPPVTDVHEHHKCAGSIMIMYSLSEMPSLTSCNADGSCLVERCLPIAGENTLGPYRQCSNARDREWAKRVAGALPIGLVLVSRLRLRQALPASVGYVPQANRRSRTLLR